MATGILTYLDGTRAPFLIAESRAGERLLLTVGEELDYTRIAYLDFDIDLFHARKGEEGYFLITQGTGTLRDSGLCYFHERSDCEVLTPALTMYLYGARTPRATYAAIVTGLPYESTRVLRVKDGEYACYPRFMIEGKAPYEPIAVEVTYLAPDARYPEMARVYRRYRLAQCGYRTLKDRMSDTVRYASESLYVRVRMGWKPVPSPVAEQTPATEPPMHTACTFDRVGEIMDAYHALGVKRAEFCLVGWNVRGHDGRWPQVFPVEPQLGGEKALLRLIRHAKELGYTVSCHTNSMDAYRIAENFSEDDLIVERDGKIFVASNGVWGGGRPYNLCPVCALRQAKEQLPRVAALGFNGLHYIDVITAVPARDCCSPAHPVTRREGARTFENVMLYARDLFGGISSEGAFDESMRDCDFILYTSFANERDHFDGMLDCRVPLWQLVYHGLVMSCPYSVAVNAIISGEQDNLLKTIEYGGRPAIYYYSKFVTESKERQNWMGDCDFTCHDESDMQCCAQAAKRWYDIYEPMAYLQLETMEDHREVAPGVFAVTYSDGSCVTVDYNQKTWKLEKA